MNKNRKKAEKPAAKKDKKDGPINWDSQSETSVEKNKPKKGEKGDGGKKKKKNSDELSKNKAT